jgi:hypothetical protein
MFNELSTGFVFNHSLHGYSFCNAKITDADGKVKNKKESLEGVTTIPKGSRIKRSEAGSTL